MENIKEMKDTCVAYGYFDGVHKGHLAVAKKVVEVAKEKGLTPVIVSYAKEGQVLSTEEEKEYLFKKEGVQEVVTYSENEAEEVVVKDVLAGTLGAKVIVVGAEHESLAKVEETQAIDSGQIYVNSYFSKGMIESPGTGWRESGLGVAGIQKYMISKTIFVDTEDGSVPY